MSVQKIVSFGFRHEWPPNPSDKVLVLDVRQKFKNPYHDRTLRYLRGTDPLVQDDIQQTPDFVEKYQLLVKKIHVSNAEVVYIGCTGGHHRSVFLAELLAKEFKVPVEHRDIDKK